MKFKHKIGKIFKDKRGWLKKILDGNFSSCIEVYSKKGSVRANHYHKKDKHFIYVISGEILYFYKDRKKGSKTNIKLMKKNNLFFTPAMQEHMAYFTKNALASPSDLANIGCATVCLSVADLHAADTSSFFFIRSS